MTVIEAATKHGIKGKVLDHFLSRHQLQGDQEAGWVEQEKILLFVHQLEESVKKMTPSPGEKVEALPKSPGEIQKILNDLLHKEGALTCASTTWDSKLLKAGLRREDVTQDRLSKALEIRANRIHLAVAPRRVKFREPARRKTVGEIVREKLTPYPQSIALVAKICRVEVPVILAWADHAEGVETSPHGEIWKKV